jgi:hypothetical protein
MGNLNLRASSEDIELVYTTLKTLEIKGMMLVMVEELRTGEFG